MTTEENNLIMAAQKGDAGAFEQLIYKYDRNVLSIAYSFINSSEDAKDIYQEVFLRVFKGIKKFEFRSEFSTWLYRITANVCLTYNARKKKYAVASLDEETFSEDGDSQTLADTIAGESNTDEDTMNSEVSDHIEKGLEKLSPQQRLVFTMKHYRDYKIREIASIMNCAEGTIKNYLFTGTQKMRSHLKEVLNKD